MLFRTIDTITEEEKRLFNPETTISEDTETIVVKIYRLDVESKKGKLYILEGMEPKDSPFQIIGDQAIGPYIDALKTDQIKVNILREMAGSLTGKPYLKRVLLVAFPGTRPSQGQLFKKRSRSHIQYQLFFLDNQIIQFSLLQQFWKGLYQLFPRCNGLLWQTLFPD